MLRLADGPDEVHKMVIALRELKRASAGREAEAARPRRRGARLSAMVDATLTRNADLALTDEQQDFVAAIRDFCEREVAARRRTDRRTATRPTSPARWPSSAGSG